MATRLYSVVIDSTDPHRLARWWSDALEWPVTYDEPDEVVVEPSEDNGTVPALVFGLVPEGKATKNRIHLDLTSTSAEHQVALVARLIGSGAQRADVGQTSVPWVVLTDLEGNELCVLEPREGSASRGPVASIVVDAAEPAALARFWEAASGWRIGLESEQVVSLSSPNDDAPSLDFVSVPEPRTVKNRLHLDVAPFADDDQGAEVARLVDLGAKPADIGQGEVSWVVLTDPEGNEFCVLTPR